MTRWRFLLFFSAATTLAALAGCSPVASSTYRPGALRPTPASPGLLDDGPQVERGQARPVIDAIGWTTGIPDRVLLLDWRVDRHGVGEETEEAIVQYLAVNDLPDVKVRLNQYDPAGEWRRLTKNTRVGAGWRYTFGTVSWLGYTIFPGRIWGGDNFNPYTNTINVYSDHPAIALHEGGHAKDFAQARYPGTYAAAYVLPVVPLYHEAMATNDVFAYERAYGSLAEEQEAYRILHPAYGSYAGSAAAFAVPGPDVVFRLGGIVGGHLTGSTRAYEIVAERKALGIPEAGRSIELADEVNLVDHEEDAGEDEELQKSVARPFVAP